MCLLKCPSKLWLHPVSFLSCFFFSLLLLDLSQSCNSYFITWPVSSHAFSLLPPWPHITPLSPAFLYQLAQTKAKHPVIRVKRKRNSFTGHSDKPCFCYLSVQSPLMVLNHRLADFTNRGWVKNTRVNHSFVFCLVAKIFLVFSKPIFCKRNVTFLWISAVFKQQKTRYSSPLLVVIQMKVNSVIHRNTSHITTQIVLQNVLDKCLI